MSKVVIKQDNSCEMLAIYKDDDCVFFGNEWDFSRSGRSLTKLFRQLGLEVELTEDWSYGDEEE